MNGALVMVVAITLGFVLIGLVGPLLAQIRLRRTRSPTASDRAQLDARLPPLGFDPTRVVVIDTVGEASVEVSIRGVHGYRILFVTDFVLEELDAEVASALFAAEVARARLWYREFQVVAAGIVIALGTASLILLVPFELGFGGLLIAAVVLFAIGRRLQYRADAQAAAIVGAEVIADAFETVGELHGADLSRGGWRTYLQVQPGLGDRIYRLRQRS